MLAPVELFTILTVVLVHFNVSMVKSGTGKGFTLTVRVAELIHPVMGSVYEYVKVKDPTPETAGLNVANCPLVIPVPDHVPPAGLKPVRLNGGVDADWLLS